MPARASRLLQVLLHLLGTRFRPREVGGPSMLRSICLSVVKAAAVIVCLGVGASACEVRERGGVGVRHESHGDYRWDRHEEYRR